MKNHDPLPANLKKSLKDANIYSHSFLPIAAAYCRRLGLVELVNNMISTQMELKPGLVVQAMVLDVLSGRNPLYLVEGFLEVRPKTDFLEMESTKYFQNTLFNR